MSLTLLQSCLRLSDGRQHALAGTCSIGRHPTNELELPGSEVSRRHAIVQSQGSGEYWIIDLGSANGTYLNGRRLSQAVRLHNGDVIRIAGIELEFATEILSAMHPAARSVLASTIIRFDQADCWLMVAGIDGAVELSQKIAPELFPRLTGTWFKDCSQIIDDCGGHMTQYLGDGFFCYWEGGGDSHVRLRAALARLREAQSARTLPFHVILHHGSVMLGSVPTMNERSLNGPEVNFAFRMDTIASALGQRILLSGKAARMLQTQDEILPAGECAVKGFPGMHRFYAPALPCAD